MPDPVLIVDDDLTTRSALEQILRLEGVAVVSVASGKEAIAYCTQQLPSIVLLDYMMPDMDGLEVLRRIRAINDASAFLTVVIFTAAGDDWLREKAMSLGATEVWLKASLTGEEIKRRLHAMLG